MKSYYVYILASLSGVLYTGVTNDLLCRVWEHPNDAVDGFSKQYRVHRLVHFEQTPDVYGAIAREKQIKGWRRSKKVALIEVGNPRWRICGRRSAVTGPGREIPRSARSDEEHPSVRSAATRGSRRSR